MCCPKHLFLSYYISLACGSKIIKTTWMTSSLVYKTLKVFIKEDRSTIPCYVTFYSSYNISDRPRMLELVFGYLSVLVTCLEYRCDYSSFPTFLIQFFNTTWFLHWKNYSKINLTKQNKRVIILHYRHFAHPKPYLNPD